MKKDKKRIRIKDTENDKTLVERVVPDLVAVTMEPPLNWIGVVAADGEARDRRGMP